MRHHRLSSLLLAIAALGVTAGITLQSRSSTSTGVDSTIADSDSPSTNSAQAPAFLVVAGGGAPRYNEIALEKNVRYFQRTLAYLEQSLAEVTIFFANGNDGQATIRYLDPRGTERFKVPDIDALTGAATQDNVQAWLDTYPQTAKGRKHCPAFMYFTGHGARNSSDADNNAMILWEEALMSVQDLATALDQWPTETPFVTMMAQCYSGSFANLVYEGGDPARPVAPQSRCGFFATVKTRPSVGCTPLVNEADYRDYSSSFFAGLSGRDRLGEAVASADYNDDGAVSYAEAHAFAKVDGETSDWPISTSETWLQRQVSTTEETAILDVPIQDWLNQARPEQRFVITSLSTRLGYPLTTSFNASPAPQAQFFSPPQEVLTAYHQRLRMELLNVGMEDAIRSGEDAAAIAVLEQLLACEAGSW
ncbi:MAG: Caspase domain-containing protein [Leptolyngbya sp. SIOISBB]|nr:Caspase domain-containing protein [Leptolyngbya sp. SIOISBB]